MPVVKKKTSSFSRESGPSTTGIIDPAVRAGIVLKMPKGPLYVGSYYQVGVSIGGRTRVRFEDLGFEIPGGPEGGLVSMSRDNDFDPKRPTFMLLAGYRPGKYILNVTNRKTGKTLVTKKFELDALWPTEERGPPRWFTGIVPNFQSGAAWGGGPADVQNFNIVPATGTRRIAILLVDTSSQRFTTDATALKGHRDRWLNEVFNGVNDAGVTRSSRAFYREVSYNNFDLSAQVFGPVHLPGTWDDYFNSDGSPKGAYYQACFTAGDDDIDFNKFDTLLCVSQSVTSPSTKSAWPYASIGGNWGPYTTAEGFKNYGVISMPNEWGTTNSREIFETFSHELGHNLGLGDLYNPGVPGRNLEAWDMMDTDDAYPHFSLAYRLMLGWVQPSWIRKYNFASMAAPVDEKVVLNPIEKGSPPAGRSAGIEIRLADGWNYYLEYRVSQSTQIADRQLPVNDRVLGTDVVSAPYSAPISRPTILLLNNDIDGDGAVLGNGKDYEETDTTDPVYPTDFRVEVSGANGNKADVQIRYGVNSRPDPSIRPWPAGPDRQWQSPDIEVRNARNQTDPAWFNVPWVGNSNTIVASVKNNGGLDAPSVRANFYVKNFNVGGAPETFLGFDQKDIPKGGTVQFTCSVPWVPPSEGHYCVIVRIPLYQHPNDPSVVEMTELNNVAQTNYDRFISATSSPPRREMTSVEVGNPYPRRTRVFITAGHSNPLYRTYLEQAWVYLDPGETRKIRVMFEFAPDNLSNGIYPLENVKKYREIYQRAPNKVGSTSFIDDPRTVNRDCPQVLGGVQIEVVTGRATRIQSFISKEGNIRGTVVTMDDGTKVPGGDILLRIDEDGSGRTFEYQPAKMKNGSFSARVKKKGTVTAFYIPLSGYGECSSESVKI